MRILKEEKGATGWLLLWLIEILRGSQETREIKRARKLDSVERKLTADHLLD
jgi:hypothetical protein